jgi:dTDP-4-dehydrorhamnose reductase
MDYCADHVDLALAVNVKGTENVAVASEEIGARVIYVSTDLVFDGVGRFYSEEDKPNPICIYGKTKSAGEEVVSSLNTDYCIVRAAWTFGRSVDTSQCFAERMIDKLRKATPITLFTDEYRTPIYVTSLCDAILELARRRDTGIYP